jgi:hypothetical protein
MYPVKTRLISRQLHDCLYEEKEIDWRIDY